MENKHTKRRFRFLRVVLTALLVIMVLIPLGLFIATLPPGERVIKGILESQLTGQLHQPVSIDMFETNLLSRIQILGLRIHDSRPGHPPVLQIGSILVHYDLRPLLHQEIDISLVRIDSVRVAVERDTKNKFNIALLDSTGKKQSRDTTAASAPGSWKIRLGHFALNSVNIDFRDQTMPLVATIRGLSASVRGEGQDAYAVSLNSGTGEVQYATLPAANLGLRLKGIASPKAVSLDTLIVSTSGLLLSAAGRLEMQAHGKVNADVALTGSPGDLYAQFQDPLNLPDVSVAGNLNAHAHISGTRNAPRAAVHIELPDVNVRHTALSRSVIAARYWEDSVAVDTFQVHAFEGSIAGTARALLGKTLRGSGAFAVRGINLASVWSAAQDTASPFLGELNGDITMAIEGNNPQAWTAHSSFTVSQFFHLSDSLPDVKIAADFQKGAATLDVTQGDVRAQAHAALLPQQRITGDFFMHVPRLASLGNVAGIDQLAGSLQVQGSIGGTTTSPSARAELTGFDIAYQNLPVNQLHALAAYENRRLTIASALLTGDFDVDPRHPPLHLDSLGGGVHYAGNVHGTMDSLTGQFNVRLDHPSYGRMKADSVILLLTISGRNVTLSRMDLYRDSLAMTMKGSFDTKAVEGNFAANVNVGKEPLQGGRDTSATGGTIQASFAMPAKKDMRLFAVGRGLDLGTIVSIVADTAKMGGELDFDIHATGDPTDPEGTMRIALRHPKYDVIRLDSITAVATMKNRLLNLRSFDIYGANQRLTARATAQLEKDSAGKYTLLSRSPISGSVEANDVDLHIAESMLPSGSQLSGHSSLSLRWNGTVKQPNATGSFDLRDFKMLASKSVGPVALDLHGSIKGPSVEIDSSRGILMNHPFTLKGSVVAHDWKEFRTNLGLTIADSSMVSASGTVSADNLDFVTQIQHFDLAMARPFVSSLWGLSGMLDSRIVLKGSMKNPQTDGTLTIRGLRFTPIPIDSPFTNGVVHITFAGNRVHVDSVFAESEGGTLLVSGDVTLGDNTVSDINLATVIRRLQLSSEDNFTARVDTADITFRKQQDGTYLLDGDIQMGESRLISDIDLTSFIGKQSVQRVPTESPGFLQQTQINLRIRQSDSLWVDNNLAKLRLNVELAIRGRPSNPIPSGQVTIAEGKVIYLDRDFDVTKGVFLFSDPNKINPDIDLSAQTQVTNYTGMQSTVYTITFTAQGLMSELVTSLTSDPTLDNSDIIALLTVGATRTQLTQGGSSGGTGSILADRAKALASEKLSGMISRKAGSVLGLDSVSVTGNLFNFNDTWGPQLVLSKRISPRTRITYSTNVGHLNDQSIRLDYQLTKEFSLEGETDQGGNSSLSILYGLKFP